MSLCDVHSPSNHQCAAARLDISSATALTVVRLSVTIVAVKDTSAASAPTVRRRPNHATDVARLVTLAATAPRAAALSVVRVAKVALVALRSATSVARSATSHATALMPTPLTATEASAVAAAPATTVEAKVVARLVTPVVATATCPASASTAASVTTAVRMVTSSRLDSEKSSRNMESWICFARDIADSLRALITSRMICRNSLHLSLNK
ncbi:hypothetical protein F4804DRAFT_115494 [Jackrogersella minutella]|nr:hypothetical protein F4804DRAFT_115494 [Jackrogersella minutella]